MPRPSVADPAAELRRHYAIGKEFLAAIDAAGGAYARGVIADQMKQRGIASSTLYGARTFAKRYTPQQVEELCRLKIALGHLAILLPIKHVRTRSKFQREIAKHGWSVKQAQKISRERFGASEKGLKAGRRPKLPGNVAELHEDLEYRAQEWSRWVKQLAEADETSAVSLAKLPRTLRKSILAVTEAMESLAVSLQRK